MTKFKKNSAIPKIASISDKLYLKDLRSISPETFPDSAHIDQLILDIRANKPNTQEALNELTSVFGKYIVSIAKKYQGKGLDIGDLVSNAMIGFYMAIYKTYKIDSPNKFITYIYSILARYMREALDENNNIVRLPKNIRNDLMWVRRLVNTMESHGEPEEAVIEGIINLANERIEDLPQEHIDRLCSYADFGMFSSFSVDTHIACEEDYASPLDFIEYDVNTCIKSMDDADIKAELQQLLENTLTPLEYDIIMYYFYDTGINIDDIKKANNISSVERVRQLRDVALAKLRKADLETLKLLTNN